jgi:signal peptidase
VLHAAGVLLLLVVLVPFVVQAAPAVVGGDTSYVVLSGSMEPAISPGDVVIVQETTVSSVGVGDVVTFGAGSETPTTHRVVDVVEQDGQTALRTKGDANEDPDAGLVAAKQLRGEVILVLPLIGYVVQFGSTLAGQVALIGVPVTLLVLTEVWRIVRDPGPATETETGESPSESVENAESDSAATTTEVDEAATAPQETDGNDEIELTTADLRASLAVLCLLATYSGVVAVLQQSFWSVGVAVGAGGLALLGVGLWYAAPAEEDTGTVLLSELPDGRTVEAESLSELLALAAETGATVYRTPDDDHFVVTADAVVVDREGGEDQ